MKKFLTCISLVSLFILSSCGSRTQKTTTETTSNSNNTVTTTKQSGADIYAGKCTVCHGSDGNMGVAGAKKIPASVLTKEEREQLISNGKGTMPAFKDQLSPDEIKAVAEYTLTFK